MPTVRPIIQDQIYNGFSVYQCKYGMGLDKIILDKIYYLIFHSCNQHEHVRFLRFDVRLPFMTAEEENRYFSSFLKDLNLFCYRKLGMRPYYLWAREQDQDNPHPHYHLIFLICDSPQPGYEFILHRAEYILSLKIGENAAGLINFCQRKGDGSRQENGIIIKQNGQVIDANLFDCIRWASYLAKNRTKDNFPPFTRRFGMSDLVQVRG